MKRMKRISHDNSKQLILSLWMPPWEMLRWRSGESDGLVSHR